jgi:xanthine dehydrogenase YagR molybdenum-binding subunit
MRAPAVGQSVSRVDGRAKVTGAARYAAEFNHPDQAHAVIVGSKVGLGRVTHIDTGPVLSLPGVRAVITHLNALAPATSPRTPDEDAAARRRGHLLRDADVHFYGQPVAVVVADTLECAERAAAALQIRYETREPVVDARDPRASEILPAAAASWADSARGDADGAFVSAPVQVAADYDIARDYHSPMEPHATVAAWNGNQLTLWSKSQFVMFERAEVAAYFGLLPENVLVICPYIGGAFGSAIRTWPHVYLAAMAARLVRRPVKLVLLRRQMFHLTGHRPRTIQRVALGASPDGRLMSVIHEGGGETSRDREHIEALTPLSTYLYSCPNVRTRYRVVPLDTGSPTPMRGPGQVSGIFALESAMDELAYALGLDPIDLRRRNEPDIDEAEGRPFSSRSLIACYDLGAARFGWERRDARPRSMRDGRLLIGWGMASATYPVYQSPASARVRLLLDGTAEVEVAAGDMGPGTYTSMTQVASDALGLPMDQIVIGLGRSDYPPAPDHSSSQTMVSIGSAVRAACLAAQDAVARCAIADPESSLFGAEPDALEWLDGLLRRRGESSVGQSYLELVRSAGMAIEAEGTFTPDLESEGRFSKHVFAALFAEVAVDPDLAMVRVRRVVGAYGAGRIVNPRLAASQCTGGMVGGIGMALMERAVLDHRDGRPVDTHMADYLVPVNLDIPDLAACFIDEDDPHVNGLGVKGLGEIAIIGVAPAIANAVFHATGNRVRELPIRIEHLLNRPSLPHRKDRAPNRPAAQKEDPLR